MRRFLSLFLILLIGVITVQAKTKKIGTWLEFELTKKLFKRFEISVIPEIRLQDNFSVDEYLIDGKLSFEPIKFLTLATAYRINTDVKNKGNEISKRFVFDATGKKGFGRFDASLRTRFTNYTDIEEGNKKANYFRPRLKLEYDIKGNKLHPFISYELFRNLTEKKFHKSRFDIGFTRKFAKINRIGIYYRLQDYFTGKNSIHIIGIDYRLKI